jgi:hypothetical protein
MKQITNWNKFQNWNFFQKLEQILKMNFFKNETNYELEQILKKEQLVNWKKF